ncbi:Phage-related protein [[Clostridium] sordellii]|uniref:hypothetical protein n=1 Tax=Paraclostridium sordellii TaxID=1505 RepID=UPI0005E8DFA0|nr:hypothetical protein [Paeniclostridium sordellii]CEN23111.1 Phage-related protein [[Clostridium] sordellii] [Paeniclostridium sordellii]CEN24059.1 Phage-related protein [[Clostridium] sordellii] [Paeniclostridium sordellii]CEN26271.1 Phage-related protein [[Clostridium] sordellii] [Paeniclostridium sordellii]CEQ32261.1 Phage-related protein [[Clostridium] sordellii] [Paeniclostridium sordellii]
MYRQIYFNNKHSFEDFDLYIEHFKINSPTPKIIKETIPFRSGSFDFSSIFNDGERQYSDRTIEITFFYQKRDSKVLYNWFDEIQMWLLNVVESELIIENIRGYFKARVASTTDLNFLRRTGKFKVIFDCAPFKFERYASDIWDEFNFITDVTEFNFFEVVDSKDILIINKGVSIVPDIVCSSDMTITIRNKTFNLKKGTNHIRKLKLKNGENHIKVTGSGTIEFLFIKELL